MQFFVECPKCKFQNPPQARQCRCGFVFPLGRNPAGPANRRAAIGAGLGLSLIGLLFFGFAFGWPVWQALHHQPGVIVIHPTFLALASLFVTLGLTFVAVAVFNFKKPKPGMDRIWKMAIVVPLLSLWIGTWVGLVAILERLGYPLR